MTAGNICIIAKNLVAYCVFDVRKKWVILVAKIEYCDIAFFGPTLYRRFTMLSFMSLGRAK